MGFGDNLMATGMARGAAARGKRIAFGDGKKIIWDHLSAEIFAGNPNIAPPGSEHESDIEWIHYCRGHRLYNEHDRANDRWKWNYDFRAIPGEIFFTPQETLWAEQFGRGYVVIEYGPRIEKLGSINKRWPRERYDEVSRRLTQAGQHVVDLEGKAPSFRHALAALARAALYIGPEGGLHHGAAAVGIPAVVVFGGWIPPVVTGYAMHTNLTGGAKKFCGSLSPCDHCKVALAAISVDEVYEAAKALL